VLTHDDYKMGVKFALKMWFSGKTVGDWRAATRRDLGDYITDHTMGKLAEIAFCRFLDKNWNIEAEPDFNIYPGRTEIDRGDILKIKFGSEEIKPPPIDVKATKPNSKWAFVELREFKRRRYWIYVWVLLDLPLDHLAGAVYEAVRNNNLSELEDHVTSLIQRLNRIEAEVAGFLYRDDLDREGQRFKAGAEVPDPDTGKKLFEARARNVGMPISKLRCSKADWDEVVEKLKAWSRAGGAHNNG